MRWLVVVVYTAIFLLGLVCERAVAQEKPCVPQGDTVVCQRAGFDALVRATLDAKADAKTCKIQREAVEAERDDVRRALDEQLAKVPPPPPPPPPKPSKVRPAIGLALGVIGGALVTTAVASDFSFGARGTLGLVGLATASTGFFLTVPLD